MTWDPTLFHYACIAKGTTILAEFNPKDAELGAIAFRCLEKTPPFHATFSHTVRSKTYTFFIDDPFVYFLISDEKLEKTEALSFLKSVRDAFVNNFRGQKKDLSFHCFQGEFSPVFRQLLLPALYIIDGFGSPIGQRIGDSGLIRGGMKDNNSSSTNMKNRFLEGVIGRRNRMEEENNNNNNNNNSGNGICFSPECSPSKNKGFFSLEMNEYQRAKKVWKKQVWMVLLLDLVACVILFLVWLWVCSGLKCINR